MTYNQNKNIIIEEYKSIFFILPKNACSSMKAQFIDVLGLEKRDNFPKGIHNHKIYPYPFIELKDLDKYNSEYLIYCIVRNPWDRLVSCYKDKIRSKDVSTDEFINGVALPLVENSNLFYGGMSFEAFVDVVCSIPDSISEHHFTSQLYQITNTSCDLMVNYIGRLESLNEDLERINQQTGLPITGISHLHKIKRKPYQEYYTEETREKVRIRYSADIEFFNYTFEQDNPLPSIGFVTDTLRASLSNSSFINPILREKLHSLQTIKNRLEIRVENQNLKLEKIKSSVFWKLIKLFN